MNVERTLLQGPCCSRVDTFPCADTAGQLRCPAGARVGAPGVLGEICPGSHCGSVEVWK